MQAKKQRTDAGQRVFKFFRYMVMVMAVGMFSTVAMSADGTEKVNLNQADAQTLEYIPGIGAAKAAAIIKLREQNGGFRSFKDLLEIRGIGVKILQDIQAYGTLKGGVSEISQEMRDNPPRKKVTAIDSNPDQVVDSRISSRVDNQALAE